MVVLNRPIHSVEDFLAHERETDIWTFPHFVRYLRALIWKLTPQPHRSVLRLFEALDKGIFNEHVSPVALRSLCTDPPRTPSRGQAARKAANAICEIIGFSVGCNGVSDYGLGKSHDAHSLARRVAKDIEREALNWLSPDALFECSVAAHVDGVVDATKRDAALAAVTAGHFKLAYDIVTREA